MRLGCLFECRVRFMRSLPIRVVARIFSWTVPKQSGFGKFLAPMDAPHEAGIRCDGPPTGC